MLACDVLHELRDGGLVAHVERHEVARSAALHVGADDACALGREALDAREPDARRGPRHDRDLACQPTHTRTSARRGRLPRRTQERKPLDEVRALLRDPGRAARGTPAASTAPTRTRSSRRCSPSSCGWDAFWTVEHHFLEEYSHCSNPEVLYGAIAARTSRMRLGYGVRLMPKPYNHPVRTAESVAVLDLLSDGRVDFGTGRSSTRAELEGFGIDPHADARRCGRRRSSTSSAAGRTTSTRSRASTGRCRSAACCRSRSSSRTRRSGAPRRPRTATGRSASSASGSARSRSGVPPEEVKKKIDIYRAAIATLREAARQVGERPGGHLHDDAVRADARRGVRRSRASPSSGTRRRARA